MSNYVRLKELRRLAILSGDQKLAEELLLAAEGLVKAGKVTDKEFLAASVL